MGFPFCFVKYILDAEDSQSASVINLYPILSSFSIGSFVAPLNSRYYLSDAGFFHCFCHWWEIPSAHLPVLTTLRSPVTVLFLFFFS